MNYLKIIKRQKSFEALNRTLNYTQLIIGFYFLISSSKLYHIKFKSNKFNVSFTWYNDEKFKEFNSLFQVKLALLYLLKILLLFNNNFSINFWINYLDFFPLLEFIKNIKDDKSCVDIEMIGYILIYSILKLFRSFWSVNLFYEYETFF